MQKRNGPMSLALAMSLLAVALLVGPVSPLVSHAAWRPNVPLGLDLYMPVPEDNPLTSEKVELGRKLFSDPILLESAIQAGAAAAASFDPCVERLPVGAEPGSDRSIEAIEVPEASEKLGFGERPGYLLR